jgi:hypothetical protein
MKDKTMPIIRIIGVYRQFIRGDTRRANRTD